MSSCDLVVLTTAEAAAVSDLILLHDAPGAREAFWREGLNLAPLHVYHLSCNRTEPVKTFMEIDDDVTRPV